MRRVGPAAMFVLKLKTRIGSSHSFGALLAYAIAHLTLKGHSTHPKPCIEPCRPMQQPHLQVHHFQIHSFLYRRPMLAALSEKGGHLGVTFHGLVNKTIPARSLPIAEAVKSCKCRGAVRITTAKLSSTRLHNAAS